MGRPKAWGNVSSDEAPELLKAAGIAGEITYAQSCHLSPHEDMTVGRYTWHDESGAKRRLFVLEKYGDRIAREEL